MAAWPAAYSGRVSSSATLSFLSWNLAMFERSAEAPSDWSDEHTQAAVREVVLARSPDLVLFQELPGIVPYVETHAMVRANPISHSGNLATLVDHHLMDDEPTHSVVPGCGLLVTFGRLGVTVANVHLAPGRGGAEERLRQLESIVATSPTDDLVIIGDTNTRTAEEAAIAELGLAGSRPPQPTWDGKRNRFRPGPSADFIAYFTRHFARGEVDVGRFEVLAEPDVELPGHAFHLSDHYGLAGEIVTRCDDRVSKPRKT